MYNCSAVDCPTGSTRTCFVCDSMIICFNLERGQRASQAKVIVQPFWTDTLWFGLELQWVNRFFEAFVSFWCLNVV